MRTLMAASMLALAGSAWGQQTSWSNDQFSVTTDNLTFVSIVDGSAVVLGLPQVITLSNAGSDGNFPPSFFDLTFAPAAGYALHGETVSYSVELDVDQYTAPATMVINGFGSVSVGANGTSHLDKSSDGGRTTYSGSFFVADPALSVEMSAVTHEGQACPLGHDADGCDFGIYLIFTDSVVAVDSLTVTPLLSAVPEPGMATMWITALGALAAAALLTRRRAASSS